MSLENAKIECHAQPITHAVIYFKNDDERKKNVRSAKELRGRIKMTRLMDAKERFHEKRMGEKTRENFRARQKPVRVVLCVVCCCVCG